MIFEIALAQWHAHIQIFLYSDDLLSLCESSGFGRYATRGVLILASDSHTQECIAVGSLHHTCIRLRSYWLVWTVAPPEGRS